MKDLIVWKDEYSVQVEELDDQHLIFISLLNLLYRSVCDGDEQQYLKKILDDLFLFTEEHFETEENYFDQFYYERSEIHKQKHQELRIELDNFRERYKEEKLDGSCELFTFLVNWFIDHLLNEDHLYIECFKKHGLT